MTFEKVQTPTWDPRVGPEATIRAIDEWLKSPALEALVDHFGGLIPRADAELRASYLDGFASENWDFRRGQERDEAVRVPLRPTQERMALGAASALGLRDPQPPKLNSYDAVLILGGLARGCLVRPAYVRQLMDRGLIATEFSALTAFRPLSSPERAMTGELGVTAEDEYGVMLEGMRRAFGPFLAEPPSVTGEGTIGAFESWRTTSWRFRVDSSHKMLDVKVNVTAAPSSVPSRRANSADTYNYWAATRPPHVKSVLLITHPVYVAYQGTSAIEILGLRYGLNVETVGITDEAAYLGDLTQTWEAQDYLQEIRASISALVRLRQALLEL